MSKSDATWLSQFGAAKDTLENVAHDEQAQVLDRINAYIELARLTARNAQQCWGYLHEAQHLIHDKREK